MYKYTICIYVHISSRIWKGHHHLAPNHVPILVSLGNAGQSALCFCCQSCKALRSNSEIDDNQKDSDISIQCWDCWSLKDTQFVFQQKDLLEESNISQIWDILWLVGAILRITNDKETLNLHCQRNRSSSPQTALPSIQSRTYPWKSCGTSTLPFILQWFCSALFATFQLKSIPWVGTILVISHNKDFCEPNSKTHIGSMGQLYIYPHLPYKSTIHGGKYAIHLPDLPTFTYILPYSTI